LLSLAAARSPEAPVSGGGELPWRRVAQAIAERLAPGDRATFATLVQVARSARAAGEDDDWLYARVQATVRAALVRQGERLVASGALASPGDVFWLPFDRVRALASSESPAAPAGLRALVETARSEHARALQDPPELAGSRDDATEIARATGVVHGQRASAGRAIGRAVVLRGRRELDPAAIIVAATLLPTELPLLRAAGLVVETGGVLDHVAAQARERGIPAIVGARGACAAVADGDWVLLDADAGCLIRLG
jgi:pyruvate,water dikinase